jgi:glycosyltransferase involved in cell wall biosynthesis
VVKVAVLSALDQTMSSLEVIVIVDGPDEATVKELAQIQDSRLRVVELAENGGAAKARDAGVKEAQGSWIAFLDDDDEWLPEKLDLQLQAAKSSPYPLPIIASRVIAITGKGELIWPRRLPDINESIDDYLLVRRSLFKGATLLSTSTILTKKELLERVNFGNHVPMHEDYDWLLRVTQLEEVGIEIIPEATTIMNVIDLPRLKRQSLSNKNTREISLNWIRSVRHLISPAAYSSFIITHIACHVSSARQWEFFFPLLWECVKLGKLSFFDYLLYLVIWLVPQELRQDLRQKFSQNSQSSDNHPHQANDNVKTEVTDQFSLSASK